MHHVSKELANKRGILLKTDMLTEEIKEKRRKRRELIGFICSPLIYIVGRRYRKTFRY
ncbi:hypothetical protein F6Y02_01880 [Bacillus megaterium]|nr:hypothetical protein [Priestia megaterium]